MKELTVSSVFLKLEVLGSETCFRVASQIGNPPLLQNTADKEQALAALNS